MFYLYNGLFEKALCKNSYFVDYFVDYLVNYSVDYLCYGNVFFKMLDFSFRDFVKTLCKNYLKNHLKDYLKKKLLGNANGNEKVAPIEGLFKRIGLLRYRDRADHRCLPEDSLLREQDRRLTRESLFGRQHGRLYWQGLCQRQCAKTR